MTLQSAISLILPRPVDFFVKGVLTFAIGAGVALAEGRVARQLDPLYTGGFHSVLEPHAPFHNVSPILLVMAWFLIQSFLVEQAKYTWNDIRDHRRDRSLPLNRRRPLARSRIGVQTYVVLALRWGSGLVLAYLLDPRLFAVVVYLSLLQVLYEFWAKPASGRYPTLLLFLAAGGGLLRFVGGAMAVGGDITIPRLWLYGLSTFAFGVLGVSAIWRGEANYLVEKGMSLLKTRSVYYRQNGRKWMWTGAAAATTFMMILIADALVPRILWDLHRSILSWGVYSILGLLLGAGVASVVLILLMGNVVAGLWNRIPLNLPGTVRNRVGGAALLVMGCILLTGIAFVAGGSVQTTSNLASAAVSIAYLLVMAALYGVYLSMPYASLAEMKPPSRRAAVRD